MLKLGNSIVMEGNLVRDPTLVTTPKGSKVCKFSIAHNRYYQVNDEKRSEVSFFDVEVWNQMAVKCHGELKKGKSVRVAGRLKQDRWLDENGKQHSRVKIIGNDVQFYTQAGARAEPEATESVEEDEVPTF